MSKNVADIIVETLQLAGAKRCYGVPGDTLNHFTDAIRRSNIRFVHMRHEEAGGFAAGAEALTTDTLTICAGSCGPGSLHFINGLFESHRNRSPVVLIASNIVLDEQGYDFPQEVDFTEVYKSCSVFCGQITTPDQAQRKTAQAAQAALSKRGLAVLVMPADIAKRRVSPGSAPDGPSAFAVHRAKPLVRPGDNELAAIAGLLNSGSKITIYGGSGCEGAHDQIVALAEKLKAPVAFASRAKDFLEYDNPYCVGMIGLMGHESGCYAVAECDTLLLLGSSFAWKQFYPAKAKIIQVDIKQERLGMRHPVAMGVVGDAGPTAEALLPLIKTREDSGFLEECLKRHANSLKSMQHNTHSTKRGLIHPQFLTTLIDRHAKEDAMITADGGSPMVWLLRYMRSNGKRRTLCSLLHGTMANAMPQALGLQLAHPGRQVIALCGDGGIAMLLGDLLTAVQEKIPVKLAIYNNSSLFFVEMEQRVEGLLDSYTNLSNPNFAKLAEVAGFWGRRVERGEELDEAVRDWLDQPGPALLDVVVDRELVMPPSVGLNQAEGMMLYAGKAVLGNRTGDLLTMIAENLAR